MDVDPPPDATRCAQCGAETATPPAPRADGEPPRVGAPMAPGTRCEWCGAEYPGPGDEP